MCRNSHNAKEVWELLCLNVKKGISTSYQLLELPSFDLPVLIGYFPVMKADLDGQQVGNV